MLRGLGNLIAADDYMVDSVLTVGNNIIGKLHDPFPTISVYNVYSSVNSSLSFWKIYLANCKH